jgi:son of sevenless-like protein
LTDLTFIEDGNPDLIEGGLINWVKRRRLATVIKDIQQYQLKPYCLEEVPFIQEYILTYMPLSEDEAYKMSLYRETRYEDFW